MAINVSVEAWGDPGAFGDLLARARSGDERAFSALWRWAQPALLRWQAVVAPEAGEDLASEVWISVIRGLDSFDGDERHFRAWLFTIARRRAVDLARYRMRRAPTVGFDGVEAADPSDLDGEVAGEAAVRAAIGLLRQLRPEQAEVVALRIIAGLSVPETAAVVGRSPAAIRLLCHRGLRHLATLVDTELLTAGNR